MIAIRTKALGRRRVISITTDGITNRSVSFSSLLTKGIEIMKNTLRQICSRLLGVVSGKGSPSSIVSMSVLVAIGLLCISYERAFAGEDSGGLSLTSPSAPIVVPTDPEAQLTPEQGKLFYDRFASGDWGGYRTLLHNHGIDFNLDYYGEGAGNISGGKDHFSGYPKGLGESWAYADQTLLGVDLDFQKLVGWEGASFSAYFTERTGNNLGNFTNPNALQQYQQIFGRGQTWRITRLWFKQKLFNDVLEIKAGLIPVGDDFANFYAFPFENLTFTAGTIGNVAGYSIFNWPVSQWATDIKINATRDLAVKVGLFQFNNYYISNNYYLRIDNPGGTTGAVIPVEIDWSPKLHIGGKDLPGMWNFTIYGNTNHQETTGAAKSFLANAPGVQPGLLGSGFTGDYGFAASIWQQVTAPDPERPKTGLSLFASTTWADPRSAFQNFQAFTGAYYWGPWSKRPYDTFGVAFGYNKVAGNVQQAERQYIATHHNSGFSVQNNEYVNEIYYSFDVYHGVNLQPDLQYIVNPGGYHGATNQLVLGVQISAPF
jgi:porin